jgi:hypothetical protein
LMMTPLVLSEISDGAHLSLDNSYGPFWLLLVAFPNVVGFVSLRSLWWYRRCHHQSISFFFLSPLSSQITRRWETRERKQNLKCILKLRWWYH